MEGLFSINLENEQKQVASTFVLPNRRSPTLPLTILTTTLKLYKTTKENNSKLIPSYETR